MPCSFLINPTNSNPINRLNSSSTRPLFESLGDALGGANGGGGASSVSSSSSYYSSSSSSSSSSSLASLSNSNGGGGGGGGGGGDLNSKGSMVSGYDTVMRTFRQLFAASNSQRDDRVTRSKVQKEGWLMLIS